MASSRLRNFKDRILGLLGITPDVLLIFLGLACFLATCLIAGRPFGWAWALLPGICLGALIEGVEIVDHYGLRGFFGLPSGNIADVLLRHSRDILVMNLAPLLVWIAAHVNG